MKIVSQVLVVLHIIGFGAVFGTALGQLMNLKSGTARVTNGMLHGALLLLVTGLALVGMMYAGGGDGPNNAKIGAKSLVLIIILVLVLVNRKKEKVSGGMLGAIAGLSVLNVAFAVLWQ